MATRKPKPKPKRVAGVAEGVAAVTEAAEAVTDAAKVSATNTAWKERVWTAALLAMITLLQAGGLAWLDSRAKGRTEDMKVGIDEIHKSTNSMKDALVEATEKEALARGGVEERERADERKAEKDEKEKDK